MLNLVVFLMLFVCIPSCWSAKEKCSVRKKDSGVLDGSGKMSLADWCDLGYEKLKASCELAGLPKVGTISKMARRLYQHYQGKGRKTTSPVVTPSPCSQGKRVFNGFFLEVYFISVAEWVPIR